ncbi:molecular chaperone [Pseudomonas chlororaphis]|uniref:Molecular chaperone n=1 Tax=Pseudomonas chlororaphis subsp. aurantiaca TaxID=86192 RepID=A0AAJ1E525_9PSED|nr:molecular chaperone [Pseudomonas chlororaphis]MBU4636608.1 molecular chaperone [Pseudomonas chlororaphis subsp. aurantiaca]QIT26322.1 molecular chaperone [Pseudomonas chlororaphis subsp. aurantiaca]WDH07242.1 molecular chaperone [Pseudomonas chlororaphis]WDH13571.1 molecular chaperone [Pseudomonas chlororaphis]
MIIGLVFVWQSGTARADLSFDGQNRFIMSGQRMIVTLVNEGKTAALAEVSLNWGEPESGQSQPLPLAVSKPLLRIPGGQKANVEVFYQGKGLPTDRESYLLLSVLDVPPATKTPHSMTVALRHRFKLLYRPPLKSTLDEAMAGLSWEMQKEAAGRLIADNPSPHYLTLSEIEAIGPNDQPCGQPIEHLMLPPFSTQPVDLPTCQPTRLRYQIVSDAGNPRPYGATLSADKKSHGSAQH